MCCLLEGIRVGLTRAISSFWILWKWHSVLDCVETGKFESATPQFKRNDFTFAPVKDAMCFGFLLYSNINLVGEAVGLL